MRTGRTVAKRLEPNVRTEGEAQIVMRAAVEIDLVTNVKAQANRSNVPVQSASGIENRIDAAGAKALHGTGERIESGGAIVKEEDEPAALNGQKRAQAAVAKREFGSEHAMKDAEIRTRQCDGARAGIGESLGEDLVEVVSGFRFELDAIKDSKTEAGAEAGEVGGGLGCPKIIGKDAGFDVVVFLGKSPRHSKSKEQEQEQDSFHASLQSELCVNAKSNTHGQGWANLGLGGRTLSGTWMRFEASEDAGRCWVAGESCVLKDLVNGA